MWTARHYLGNIHHHPELQAQIQQHNCLEVEIHPEDNRKGRIYTQTRQGEAVGIIKQRSQPLQEGDVFQTDQGHWLLIFLAREPVMVLRWDTNLPYQLQDFIHLGHVLGNHHYPIHVQDNCIYIKLVTDPKIMETMIYGLEIPGLTISYEEHQANTLTFDAPHAH
ncbi:MAG: urease accessory protein UreE [Halothece sp.]